MRVSVNGISLNVEQAGAGRPLLLLHGFTGSAQAWEPLVPRLVDQGLWILAPDLIGHGQSDAPADPERYRVERCAEDLLGLLDYLGVERTAVLGYSMGGRVALHLSAVAHQRVTALVLESASPGIADQAERCPRLEADNRLAAEIERDGVEAFVDRWERLPLLALGDQVPPEARVLLRESRRRSSALGLANSLRGMGAARQEPLWDRLPGLDVPALVIVGEWDEKYCCIGAAMSEGLPHARLAKVAKAGHTVHLDQPEAFAALVLDFLSSYTNRPRSAASGRASNRGVPAT